MGETIDAMNNNCTLVAVREVSRLPDDVIFKAFRVRGYKDNQGMRNPQWIGAAQDLGLQVESVTVRVDAGVTEFGYKLKKWLSLGQFLKEFSEGVYFVSVTGHALVVRDGKIIDHNRRWSLGLRRQVRFAHKVLNAPTIVEEFTNFLEIPRHGVKRVGTAAWDRWMSASEFLRTKENVTREMLLENTDYTEADFKHDFNKGLIVYKKVGV